MSDDQAMEEFGDECRREVNDNPVPRDLFMELLQTTIEAKRGERRVLPPDAERTPEDYPPGAMWLSDCPENQMGMSVVMECSKRFPDDGKRARLMSQSFMLRWFALADSKENGEIDEFVKPSDDGESELINTAIFIAAAETPLNDEGDFDERLIKRAREIRTAEGE